ncbi:PTS sugar transporter subunit IIA [Bartonella sp. DGB1]|uniref:PTS sugar transporter subunit IIA n=1 Tax=Bartonella sp. DGB1 TaxID=3239807 RepID=UPI003525BCD0
MTLGEFLQPNAILLDLKIKGHNHLISRLSYYASKLIDIDTEVINQAILERENQSFTNIGGGVALPHGRLESLQKINIIFARLAEPIYFSHEDTEPIDLVFLLLSPKELVSQHLSALARIARLVRNESLLLALRNTKAKDEIYNLLATNNLQ